MIIIKEPIWKSRSVGIAEYNLGMGYSEIQISYEDKQGKRLYPETYQITKQQALNYPIQFHRGVRLRIIPIIDLHNLTEENIKKNEI